MATNTGARANGLKGLESVKAFMHDAKWKPKTIEEAEDYCAYQVSFDKDVPVVGCLLEVYVDQQQFVSYLLYQPAVPPAKRSAVLEFIARVNHGMKIGNLEMDVATGDVRYKSSVCFAGAPLSKVLVYDAVMMGLNSIQPYSAAYLSVVNGEQSPEDAVAAAESA